MLHIKKNLLLASAILISFLISCSKTDMVYPKTVTDIDGNIYNTVIIGDQLWMKENLRTTKFSNGDLIPTTDPINKSISFETNPTYQWFYFANKPNPYIYGRFYTWYSIIDKRNVCPEGWHVPTNAEWKAMINYLGGFELAGGKLKDTNPDYWGNINVGATNSSGFSAVPTSIRHSDGTLFPLSLNAASFWTPIESDFIYDGKKSFAVSFKINADETNIYEYQNVKNAGLACRCIMGPK